MKIKHICMIFLLVLMQLIQVNSNACAAQKIIIGIYNDNPDYSAVREVFVSGLTQEADKIGMEVEFIELINIDSCQEFIQSLKEQAKNANMIFTAGTPNAMAIKEAEIKIPVLFSAVADPKEAELVKSFHHPDSNFTGAYCAVAAHTQLQTLLKVLPNAKVLGLLYNPRDPAPVSQVQSWHKAAAYLPGIKIMDFQIPERVDSNEELAEVTKGMVGIVDVIVTTADAQVSPYGKGLISVANEHHVPTYVSLSHLVEKGALFSLGFNFEEATRVVNIPQAIKILQGIPPEAIPVGTYPYYDLIINLKTAKKIGVNFSDDVINSAAKIVR
ncbi:MAG: ABC transporter substrate-binding protein [Candidatus Omnitrophica bacterium]|nr:ABC transporter substrate-binding protein [Candidatus Omnitrophota bacterium]